MQRRRQRALMVERVIAVMDRARREARIALGSEIAVRHGRPPVMVCT
jgi:hypothetical protein